MTWFEIISLIGKSVILGIVGAVVGRSGRAIAETIAGGEIVGGGIETVGGGVAGALLGTAIGGPVGGAVGAVGGVVGAALRETRKTGEADGLDIEENRGREEEQGRVEEQGEEEKLKTEMFEKSGKFYDLLAGQWIDDVWNCIGRLEVCCGNDEKGKKRIESFLESARTNVAIDMLGEAMQARNENEKENYLNCFVKRLGLMTSFAKYVHDNFNGEYWIESTGSDPHQNGEHALFLINKGTNEKIVYKPHDLSADFTVLGKTPSGTDDPPLNKHGRPISNSMFEKMNKKIVNKDGVYGRKYETKMWPWSHATVKYKLGEKPPLATMEIDKDAHTEEFISKKGNFTPNEAKEYFYKAGVLDVATKIMAVIDLHADNIMPSDSGPMIIDPEVAFFDCVDSQLRNTLRGFDSSEAHPNSTFIITEYDGTKKTSSEVFRDEASKYYGEYKKGYNFMVRKLKNEKMKESLKKKYGKLLGDVGKVRIVPLLTSNFSRFLQASLGSDFNVESINLMKKEIEKEIRKKERFIFNREGIEIFFPEGALEEEINKTLENGTIISMYVDVKNGSVFLSSEEVAYFVKNGTEDRINREKIIEIAQAKLSETIESLEEI